jgi:hypothetical protein
MLHEFAQKKFRSYESLLEFHAGRITLDKIRSSQLPHYIINFIENYTHSSGYPLEKIHFDEILNKAIIFNINYIIKPCNTILKFLFGSVESRRSEFIAERLKYFQFYGYYTGRIYELVNDQDIISVTQVRQLLNSINLKILQELSDPDDDVSRKNLIKLLFFYFHDEDKNRINLSIPTKILSLFLYDKGFYDLKNKADNFFSDEIYFQEAVELINPRKAIKKSKESDIDISDDKLNEIISRAKSVLMNNDLSDIEIGNMRRKSHEDIPDFEINDDRDNVSGREAISVSSIDHSLSEYYSEELIFASKFPEIPEISDEEKKHMLIDELFCEQTYRNKIIKHIFRGSEDLFREKISVILDQEDWSKVTEIITDLFGTNKVDYLSEEAVKFVDILQDHFIKKNVH